MSRDGVSEWHGTDGRHLYPCPRCGRRQGGPHHPLCAVEEPVSVEEQLYGVGSRQLRGPDGEAVELRKVR